MTNKPDKNWMPDYYEEIIKRCNNPPIILTYNQIVELLEPTPTQYKIRCNQCWQSLLEI